MKKTRIVLIGIFALLMIVSCGGEQVENNQRENKETPNALKDEKLNIKSYSRTNDLTEELYQELVNNNTALKKFEDDLREYLPKPNELNEKFQQFESKSNNYYSSANDKTADIGDSLLKKKVTDLISSSSSKYKTKTTELNSLVKQISKNGSTINDYHTVLKIVLTLPLIEKYQDDNMPNQKEFKDLIPLQEKLIFQIDSLTPNYKRN
jgi:hypothetical protein